MNIPHETLTLLMIIIGITVSNSLVKHIALRNASFIGSKSKRYKVYYEATIIMQNILIEVTWFILIDIHKIFTIVTICYMFIALYMIFTHLINIRALFCEKQVGIEEIYKVHKGIILLKKYKTSIFKVLTQHDEKIEFEISLQDAIKLKEILNKQSVISKVYFYKSSGRLYGIEILNYN